MGSDEWFSTRLAKITASKWYTCMGERGIGEGGLSYIYTKIGEELTGISRDKELANDEVLWGVKYEPEATLKFGKHMGLDFLVVQKLIHDTDTKFSCTPDALIWRKESVDGLCHEVEPVEVKCYPTYANFISCAACSTPAEIKKQDKEAYWQLLFQMNLCDSLKGYLVYYHPDFKVGGFRVIEFRKKDLLDDFKLLAIRKEQALNIFNEKRELLMNIKN